MIKFKYIGGEGAPENDTIYGVKVGKFGDIVEVDSGSAEFAVIDRHHWFERADGKSTAPPAPPSPPQFVPGPPVPTPLPDQPGAPVPSEQYSPIPVSQVDPLMPPDIDAAGEGNAFDVPDGTGDMQATMPDLPTEAERDAAPKRTRAKPKAPN